MSTLLSNEELMKLIADNKVTNVSGVKPADNDLYRIYSFLEKYNIIPDKDQESVTVKSDLLHKIYNMIYLHNKISSLTTFIQGAKCFLDFDQRSHRFSVSLTARDLLNKVHGHLEEVKNRKINAKKRTKLKKFLDEFIIRPGLYWIKLRVLHAIYKKINWSINRMPSLTIDDFERYIEEFLPKVDDYVRIETVEHLLTPKELTRIIKAQKASKG